MNKKQWFTAAFGFFLLNILFINLDVSSGHLISLPKEISETGNVCLDLKLMDLEISRDMLEKYDLGDITEEEYYDYLERDYILSESDIYCMLREEVYAPFIYLSFFLFILCMVLGFLEPKER